MQKDKLKLLVGKDWFPIIDSVLTPEIAFEIDGVRKAYKDGKPVYPESIKVWKAFKECPLNKLKVILMINEPYSSYPDQATGLALETGLTVSVEYDAILEAFQDCYPTHFNTRIMDSYLQPWANMGVLLLNTSLTVEANKPLSHQSYWERFSRKLLYTLYERDKDLIFITIGEQSQQYISHPIYKEAHIMNLEYPSITKKWEHNDLFLAINRKLKSLGRNEIEWDYEEN